MGDDVAMPENCLKCKHSRYYDHLHIECERFGWKINREIAKRLCVCKAEDKHHIFPEGRLVPVKLYIKGKVIP